MDPIQGLPGSFHPGLPATRPDAAKGPSFQDTLKSFTREVNMRMKEADRKAAEFAVGKNQGIHEVMIASEKAGISFKLLMEIRNKLLDAYQEIMRMSF